MVAHPEETTQIPVSPEEIIDLRTILYDLLDKVKDADKVGDWKVNQLPNGTELSMGSSKIGGTRWKIQNGSNNSLLFRREWGLAGEAPRLSIMRLGLENGGTGDVLSESRLIAMAPNITFDCDTAAGEGAVLKFGQPLKRNRYSQFQQAFSEVVTKDEVVSNKRRARAGQNSGRNVISRLTRRSG